MKVINQAKLLVILNYTVKLKIQFLLILLNINIIKNCIYFQHEYKLDKFASDIV